MHIQDQHRSRELSLLATDIKSTYSLSLRRNTEAFIHQCFSKAYGADISHYMPILLCLKDPSSPRAALGLRPATNDRLFLENYLDQPLEDILSGKTLQPVSRCEIIEVGNLAIAERGDARALVIAMAAFLLGSGYKWACFTIPPLLINSFRRLGLPLIELGPARIEMLPEEEQKSWGSYYAQKPRVMAGYLPEARQFLLRYSLQEQAMLSLWRQARRVGSKAA